MVQVYQYKQLIIRKKLKIKKIIGKKKINSKNYINLKIKQLQDAIQEKQIQEHLDQNIMEKYTLGVILKICFIMKMVLNQMMLN